jgi:hypothetical protein
MNRRQFVNAGLSVLFSYACPCGQYAMARSAIHGCRRASAGDGGALRDVRPVETSELHATYLLGALNPAEYNKSFKVNATLCVYDDSDGPNALAMREVMFPGATDGTVLLGLSLKAELDRLIDKLEGITPENNSIMFISKFDAVELVTAHEYAHILQFKNGMKPGGPWQMEPHADFLAGWYQGCQRELYARLDREKHRSGPVPFGYPNPDREAAAIFSLGDTDFNSPDHHGSPQFREAMVRAGFQAGYEDKLSVEAAFEKGKRVAGLA